MAIDANDIVVRLGPAKAREAILDALRQDLRSRQRTDLSQVGIISLNDLAAAHPIQAPLVIDGVCRRGDTVNLVSGPKGRKSFLRDQMALCLATGNDWLGFGIYKQNRVLIIDNELKPADLAWRMNLICSDMGIDPKTVGDDWITYRPLRGRLIDVIQLTEELSTYIKPGQFDVLFLDALYRAFPIGMRENDNTDMAIVYNYIDKLALALDVVIVVIHHFTKGAQGWKMLTDLGAGGGAQARAVDHHIVVRDHEDGEHKVLEGAPRNFPPLPAKTLEFRFPRYHLVDIQPVVARSEDEQPAPLPSGMTGASVTKAPKWAQESARYTLQQLASMFVETYVTEEWKPVSVIKTTATHDGLKARFVQDLIPIVDDAGLVEKMRNTGPGRGMMWRLKQGGESQDSPPEGE